MRILQCLKIWLDCHFAQCGLIGSVFAFTAVFVPQIKFRNPEGGRYSVLNHYVSELGWLGVSEWSFVFNTGLLIAGVFFALYMIGLGRQFGGRWGILTSLFGAGAALGGSMVGLFPVTNNPIGLFAHLGAAGLSFTASWLAFFSASFMLLKNRIGAPRWLAVFTVLGLASFMAGLTINPIKDVDPHLDYANMRIVNRPDIWKVAVVEWLIISYIGIFIAGSSIYFEIRRTLSSQN